MTQHAYLLEMFRTHGGMVTLGQIMQTTLAAEYRARISELRRQGFVITCTKGKRASDNVYRLEPVQPELEMAV
jgi:hypothetical protein